MTTWPSATKATTNHLDSGTDKPRLARPEIKQNVDNTNDIIDMFNIASPQDKQFLKYDSGNARFELTDILETDGIAIEDNNIKTNRSNDDLNLIANGSGYITTKSIINFDNTYKEKVNTLTSAASITVDCDVASIHKVTLSHNATFSLTNLTEGQSVTLIITQDGTGTRTGTFTSDTGSIAFPLAQRTLSTNSGFTDMVVIMYDGSRTLGTLARAFQ
jgi:hypothetical protein